MPKPLADELYHYTGIHGLKGIIESQTLWATHYKYLNDAEEVGTCQWDETHPVKKLLYNIRAWLIFNLAHTPNHCLIVR